MLKHIFIFLTIVALLFSCAGPSKEPVTNNTVTESGDNLWTAKYFNARIQMDKSFKFVGSQDKSDQRVSRKYYVYDAGDGFFIYIVEIKIRGTWSFPKDYDPVLGRDQNPKQKALLEYVPKSYSVWEGMHKRSYDVVTGMGVEVPECKVNIQQAKISPSRKGGVWVVLNVPTSCDRTPSEIKKCLNLYSNTVDLK